MLPPSQHNQHETTVGVQVCPNLPLHDFNNSLQHALGSSGAGADVGSWLRGVTSMAVSYSPEARTRAGEGEGTVRKRIVLESVRWIVWEWVFKEGVANDRIPVYAVCCLLLLPLLHVQPAQCSTSCCHTT